MDHHLKLLKPNRHSHIPNIFLAQIGSNSSAFSYHSSLTPWIIDSSVFLSHDKSLSCISFLLTLF